MYNTSQNILLNQPPLYVSTQMQNPALLHYKNVHTMSCILHVTNKQPE